MSDFDTINDALELASSLYGAAEAHGILCGLLCMGAEHADRRWFDELLDGGGSGADDLMEALAPLALSTRNALEDRQFAFTPLLPDDDEHMSLRAESLGHWCRGLLFGLGLGGLAECEEKLPDNITEIKSDFEHIASATGDDAGLEEEELAYAELVEYMRVGVQLIFEELADISARPAAPRSLH